MKPILFNTEMVRAILDGRKTVTRRVVKPMCFAEIPIDEKFFISHKSGVVYWSSISRQLTIDGEFVVSPYLPGDILYVRETWCFVPCAECESDCTRWNLGIENPGCYIYKADEKQDPYERWYPSIHMPKEAARIFLRVTDVRVERLQDITEDGARAEGCDGRCSCPSSGTDGTLCTAEKDFSVERFETVWDDTIKPADRALYGWDANPWVWVIGFEQISKEEAMNDATD